MDAVTFETQFFDWVISHEAVDLTKSSRDLAHTELLIIDDWGIAALTAEQPEYLFDVVEDRNDRESSLITAELLTQHWHQLIGDPKLAAPA